VRRVGQVMSIGPQAYPIQFGFRKTFWSSANVADIDFQRGSLSSLKIWKLCSVQKVLTVLN